MTARSLPVWHWEAVTAQLLVIMAQVHKKVKTSWFSMSSSSVCESRSTSGAERRRKWKTSQVRKKKEVTPGAATASRRMQLKEELWVTGNHVTSSFPFCCKIMNFARSTSFSRNSSWHFAQLQLFVVNSWILKNHGFFTKKRNFFLKMWLLLNSACLL